MGPISQQHYIERKLYAIAARDWCRSRAKKLADVSYNEADGRADTLIRCFVRNTGPIDIEVNSDNVTVSCNGKDTLLAAFSRERFDQIAFQSRLDSYLANLLDNDEPSDQKDALSEGACAEVVLDRYERSKAAREACLAAQGTTCAICGFDFAKTYGPDFAGIIQVHHIVPLHELAEEHIVDPVRDLIPVCPNCHVALHSKPGGTYLPDELRKLMR